jgi:hypothetical protein
MPCSGWKVRGEADRVALYRIGDDAVVPETIGSACAVRRHAPRHAARPRLAATELD